MKVSVIVPVYNVEAYLRKCLDSIVNQTYSDLEIILVNDGSTDNSLSILREYEKADNRIIIIDQPNGGQSKARNEALDIMTGDHICFVDSDDYLDTTTIKGVMDLIDAFGDADMIGFPFVRVHEDGTVYPSDHPITESFVKKYDIKTVKEIYYGISPWEVWGRIFKSSVFQNIRFPEGRVYEDTWIFPEIHSTVKSIGYSTSGKYYYLQRDGSTMRKPSLANFKMRMESERRFFDHLYLHTNPIISRTVLSREYHFILYLRSFGIPPGGTRYILKFILKGRFSRLVGAPMIWFLYRKSPRLIRKVCDKLCQIFGIKN
ncbi:MAG: glycosyltransferase family 2 protein [Dysgonamonadaceae bacterium]|jgi:glycosyltransferase involved in cell wall biosynthesis|nr:glycosyltransferase family 2 protein [Dysgonamonadaceae bacterium]